MKAEYKNRYSSQNVYEYKYSCRESISGIPEFYSMSAEGAESGKSTEKTRCCKQSVSGVMRKHTHDQATDDIYGNDADRAASNTNYQVANHGAGESAGTNGCCLVN